MAAMHEEEVPEEIECGKLQPGALGIVRVRLEACQASKGRRGSPRPTLPPCTLPCSQLRLHQEPAQVQQVPHGLVLRRQVPEGAPAAAARPAAAPACDHPSAAVSPCGSRRVMVSPPPPQEFKSIAVQAYWPFHRTQCKRNEFADSIEESEPKFAKWMRKHGKQAVLKDDEVDRLERAGQAASGPGREVRRCVCFMTPVLARGAAGDWHQRAVQWCPATQA